MALGQDLLGPNRTRWFRQFGRGARHAIALDVIEIAQRCTVLWIEFQHRLETLACAFALAAGVLGLALAQVREYLGAATRFDFVDLELDRRVEGIDALEILGMGARALQVPDRE